MYLKCDIVKSMGFVCIQSQFESLVSQFTGSVTIGNLFNFPVLQFTYHLLFSYNKNQDSNIPLTVLFKGLNVYYYLTWHVWHLVACYCW